MPRVEEEGTIVLFSFISFALSSRRRDVKTVTWLPSVALAGSNLLREISRGEDALQLLVTTIINSSGS